MVALIERTAHCFWGEGVFGIDRPKMRVPQEIVDEIIDYFGVPLDQPLSHGPIFYRWDLDKSVLFSHRKIIALPSTLRTFARCPDVLLTYTRFLYICRPRNLEEIRSIISRFCSSPLVRVKFVYAPILAGFPTIFGAFLPNVRWAQFERCIFDPIALVRLRGHPELEDMTVEGCVASAILESIEDVKAGIPRRVPDGRGGVNEVTERVLRSLRAFRLESNADEVENELIKACAKSLQFVEIKTKKDWRSSAFCLDVGSCSKLRSITLETDLTETSTIDNLVILLSSLRNPPNLSRIRVLTTRPLSYDSEPHSLSRAEMWGRLDDLLCDLFPLQTGKKDDIELTFQVASRKNAAPLARGSRLLELLPSFSQVGNCEEVEV